MTVLRVNAKFLHHLRSRRAQTKAVQPDYFSIEADILIPNLGTPASIATRLRHFCRQNFFAIFFRFAIESFRAWHRNDTRALAEFFRGSERVLQFAAARHDDQFELGASLVLRCNRRAVRLHAA
jgi:hypothetical protein